MVLSSSLIDITNLVSSAKRYVYEANRNYVREERTQDVAPDRTGWDEEAEPSMETLVGKIALKP